MDKTVKINREALKALYENVNNTFEQSRSLKKALKEAKVILEESEDMVTVAITDTPEINRVQVFKGMLDKDRMRAIVDKYGMAPMNIIEGNPLGSCPMSFYLDGGGSVMFYFRKVENE
ncbi:MAG: hypothetical protein ACOC5T_05500 [Elusimicrobiota bacterium]